MPHQKRSYPRNKQVSKFVAVKESKSVLMISKTCMVRFPHEDKWRKPTEEEKKMMRP